jgi:hypothetical protein
MQIPSARRILAFAVRANPIFSSAKSPDQADSWLVLNKITPNAAIRSRLATVKPLTDFGEYPLDLCGFVAIKRNENTVVPITWLAFVVELVDSHKVK